MKTSTIILACSMAVLTLAHAQSKVTANPESILGGLGQSYRADDIPAGGAGYSYIPGSAAAADSIPAAYYGKTFKFGAGASLHLNRQCGELNPFKNMAAQLEANVKEKVEEFKGFIQSLPQLIMSQAVEYALAKLNPELYQLTQLNIDEYFELFEINLKTCEQVRQDLLNNSDTAGGHDTLMQIAIGEEWKRTIGLDEFVNSRDIKTKIAKKAADNGLPMADGKSYGGKSQDPIDFIKSITHVGLSTITGSKDSKGGGTISNSDKNTPIADHFESAEKLYEFIEEIYGSQSFRLNADGVSSVESRAGVGIGNKFSEIRNKNLEALRNYVERKTTREAFEKDTKILIAPAVIDDFRRADPYQRATLIEDTAKQEAVRSLIIKLQLAQDTLRAGFRSPDMQQSPLAGLAKEKYQELYFMMMDDITRLQNARYQ